MNNSIPGATAPSKKSYTGIIVIVVAVIAALGLVALGLPPIIIRRERKTCPTK